jgi:alpha-1,3-glucosyltransferase
MLLGILLLSLAAVNGDRPLEAAFWFALLLQFKHIFLYVAPIYGIYLLRSYCLDESRWWDVRRLKWTHLFSLAFVVLSIFAVSLGPFIIMGQLPQLLSRLFPFKRGLVHAYWAPNFWSLYLFADLVLARVLGLQGSGATGGLVGASSTIVLPEVPPIVTVLLTALAMTPCLWKLWQKPTKEVFLFAFVPISLCSFMFGWHVHEKAILITIIPFTAICLERLEWSQAFLRLTLLGHFSLLPLIFEPGESALRYFLLLAHWLICTLFINKFYRRLYRHDPHPVLNKRDAQIMAGLASVAILNEWILPSLAPHLIFLPLLLTSVYCAAGLSYVFYAVTSYTMQL